MIIAVNISKTLKSGLTVQQATERAWSLSIERCRTHDYVLGIVKGGIMGCFLLKNVFPDPILPNRVAFELEPCEAYEVENVRKIIEFKKANLRGIQRGKYI